VINQQTVSTDTSASHLLLYFALLHSQWYYGKWGYISSRPCLEEEETISAAYAVMYLTQ
jgi:hypothetical protein